MQILSDEENADVINWLPHGKGFVIHKKKKFASDVLPKYFKHSKYTSFTRKLNRWGFTRITRGSETGAYYHKNFQRGEIRMCMQMSCTTATKATMPTDAATDAAYPSQGSGLFLPDRNTIQQQLAHLQMQQHHLQQLMAMQNLAQQSHQRIPSTNLLRQIMTNNPGEEGKFIEKVVLENASFQSLQPAQSYLQSSRGHNVENPFLQSVLWAHSQQGLMSALQANAVTQTPASLNAAAVPSSATAAAATPSFTAAAAAATATAEMEDTTAKLFPV